MAAYKYSGNLHQINHETFHIEFPPWESATFAGIYRCENCEDEIGIAKGHTLPSQNHHQHQNKQLPIKWKLLFCALQLYSKRQGYQPCLMQLY